MSKICWDSKDLLESNHSIWLLVEKHIDLFQIKIDRAQDAFLLD